MTAHALNRRGAAWVWGLGVLLGLALLARFLIPYYFTYKIQDLMGSFEVDLPAEERSFIVNFLESPLDFPEEWTEVKPYSAELLAAVENAAPEITEWSETEYGKNPSPIDSISREILEGTETLLLKRIWSGEVLNASDWGQAHSRIQSASRLHACLEQLAGVPDYELNAVFSESNGRDLALKTEFMERAVKQECLKFMQCSAEAPGAEDVPSLLKMIDLLATHPASNHSLCNQVLRSAQAVAATVRVWATSTGDIPKLQTFFAGLKARRDPTFIQRHLDERARLAGHIVADIREKVRLGELERFKPGLPGKVYLALASADVKSNSMENTGALLFSRIMFTSDFIMTRRTAWLANKVLADYDLALLTLANRIRFLETGKLETDATAFAPEFFEVPLLDPGTGAPYRFNAEANKFEAERVPQPQWNIGKKSAEKSPPPGDPS